MQLTAVDWSIVGLVLAVILAVGFYVARRASGSSASFFLGGRHMPWWLLGTSMVATTFSTDTPNLVAGLVRTGGVAAAIAANPLPSCADSGRYTWGCSSIS
jgi:Na+/proline symporter